MTRVALLCGSSGPLSTNRLVLEVVAGALRASGAVDQIVDAGSTVDVPAFRVDLVDPPATVVRMRSVIESADAVVIAAPEYAGGVAGSAKNALDWCVGSATLYRKPVAVLSAGTTGGANAREQMVRTLLWQGGLVVGSLGIAGPLTKFDDAGRITDPATLDEIVRFAEVVARAAYEPVEDVIERARRVAVEAGIDPERVHPAP